MHYKTDANIEWIEDAEIADLYILYLLYQIYAWLERVTNKQKKEKHTYLTI